MYSHSSVKRTYSSRPRQHRSSQTSPPASPPVDIGNKRKRVLLDCVSLNTPSKRLNISGSVAFQSKFKHTNRASFPSRMSKPPAKKGITKPLTQLHFVVESTLRTCPSCSLSYTQGAVDDEALHKKHCLRVRRGLEWGKEEEKEVHKAGVRVVEDFVKLKGRADASYGRIIAVPAHVGGKIGAKVLSLYHLWNSANPWYIAHEFIGNHWPRPIICWTLTRNPQMFQSISLFAPISLWSRTYHGLRRCAADHIRHEHRLRTTRKRDSQPK